MKIAYLVLIFLEKLILKIFSNIIGNSEPCVKEVANCARVKSPSEEVSSVFEELLVEKAENLNKSQKEIFASFFERNKDLFSQEIIAGNCDVFEHVINVKNSSLIKQVPRRVPIQLVGRLTK